MGVVNHLTIYFDDVLIIDCQCQDGIAGDVSNEGVEKDLVLVDLVMLFGEGGVDLY